MARTPVAVALLLLALAAQAHGMAALCNKYKKPEQPRLAFIVSNKPDGDFSGAKRGGSGGRRGALIPAAGL